MIGPFVTLALLGESAKKEALVEDEWQKGGIGRCSRKEKACSDPGQLKMSNTQTLFQGKRVDKEDGFR